MIKRRRAGGCTSGPSSSLLGNRRTEMTPAKLAAAAGVAAPPCGSTPSKASSMPPLTKDGVSETRASRTALSLWHVDSVPHGASCNGMETGGSGDEGGIGVTVAPGGAGIAGAGIVDGVDEAKPPLRTVSAMCSLRRETARMGA